MKRLIALLVGLTMLLSMSLTSFAAFSDEIALNADGVTYTAALTGDAATANAGRQTTIVAYKGDTIEVGSIQYIDQAATDSFTFQLMDELTENVKVVMGGEAIDKQEVGTIFFEKEADTYTITGSVSNFVDATFIEEELVPYVEEVFEGDDEAIAEYTDKYVGGYTSYAKLFAREDWDNGVADEFVGAYEAGEGVIAADTEVAVSGVDGTYAIADLADGEYVLVLTRENALPYFTYVTVEGSDVEIDEVELKLGDALADWFVDFTDVATVARASADVGDDAYLAGNDVNVDLAVDFTDVAALVASMAEIYDYDTDAIYDLLG